MALIRNSQVIIIKNEFSTPSEMAIGKRLLSSFSVRDKSLQKKTKRKGLKSWIDDGYAGKLRQRRKVSQRIIYQFQVRPSEPSLLILIDLAKNRALSLHFIMMRMLVKRVAKPHSISYRSAYSIISRLFFKKKEEESLNQERKQTTASESPIEKEDEEYNFFERRREIDTSFDFTKLRQLQSTFLPEDLGKGGLSEVIYWSQNISTPEQVQEVMLIFNKIAENDPSILKEIAGNVQLEQYKSNVIATVYLVDKLEVLHQYALFALRYSIANQEFWEKMEFKSQKYFHKSKEEIPMIVDIAFAMGQFEFCEEIYNYVEKVLQAEELKIEECIKLYLTYSNLKKGGLSWIEKLLQGISNNIHEANIEQLSGVLPSLKLAKKAPQELRDRIVRRSEELMSQFTLPQLLNLSDFLGFEYDNEQFWKRIEERAGQLLSTRKIGPRTLESVLQKLVVSYRLSTGFVKKYIIEVISQNKAAFLQKFSPQTLSTLSKALYIYELEKESESIEQEICKTLIAKITRDINEISDEDLVRVIQDFNLTRHGSRQIYIFFEEVVRVKFIKHYHEGVNRNTIELLIKIYQNSGMCSRDLFTSLQNLLLE